MSRAQSLRRVCGWTVFLLGGVGTSACFGRIAPAPDPRSNAAADVDEASVEPAPVQPPPGNPTECGRCGRFQWTAGAWLCNGRLDGVPFQSNVSVFAGHGACFVHPVGSEAFPGLQVHEGACGCSDADNGALRCAYDEQGSHVELACVLVKPVG